MPGVDAWCRWLLSIGPCPLLVSRAAVSGWCRLVAVNGWCRGRMSTGWCRWLLSMAGLEGCCRWLVSIVWISLAAVHGRTIYSSVLISFWVNCCGQRTGVVELLAVMAHRLPLNHPLRISARDIKLWRRDEARANAVGARRYSCPCPTCPGARPLLRDTILSHVRLLGRHHLRRGWTQVIFTFPSDILEFHVFRIVYNVGNARQISASPD
jgi:hypothetical protein